MYGRTDRQTDRQTDGQTDICDSRVAFATEKEYTTLHYNKDLNGNLYLFQNDNEDSKKKKGYTFHYVEARHFF